MSYNIQATHQYDKDVKLAKKRGLDIEKLIEVVCILASGETFRPRTVIMPLPAIMQDIENVTFLPIGF